MNKDDVFDVYWCQELDEVDVRVSLVFDDTKSYTECTCFYQPNDVEHRLIGKLWTKYADEIIAHIQGKTKEQEA